MSEETKKPTAKEKNDAVIKDLTAKLPDLTPGPETDEAIAYVESKGYTHEVAVKLVEEKSVDVVLAAKRHEESGMKVEAPMEVRQAEAPKPAEPQVSRHGEVFNPEIHAQLPTGDPKTDSTGRFILKEHDYRGPRLNSQFPD